MDPTESKTMNVQLTPEQIKIVQEELETGHFLTVEDVIGQALEALRSKERVLIPGKAIDAQRQAVREMSAFIEKNRVRLEDVSVKELIHEGHRL